MKKSDKKSKKSKVWAVWVIYAYIIGMNIVLAISWSIVNAVVGDQDTLVKGLVYLIVCVAALIAPIIAIKWGVGRALQKDGIQRKDFLKIAIWVGIVPLILLILISALGVIINLDQLFKVAWYLVLVLIVGIITSLITGIVYGVATYLWLRILSKPKKLKRLKRS